jgi:hypothetical protein
VIAIQLMENNFIAVAAPKYILKSYPVF